MDKRMYRIQTSDQPLLEKEKALNALYDEYETNMTYVGSTAIEDKLQNGVPETIEMLIKANIKLWVLTGDKQETAIEIGKSCKLIQPDMRLEILTKPDAESLDFEIDRLFKQFPHIN